MTQRNSCALRSRPGTRTHLGLIHLHQRKCISLFGHMLFSVAFIYYISLPTCNRLVSASKVNNHMMAHKPPASSSAPETLRMAHSPPIFVPLRPLFEARKLNRRGSTPPLDSATSSRALRKYLRDPWPKQNGPSVLLRGPPEQGESWLY